MPRTVGGRGATQGTQLVALARAELEARDSQECVTTTAGTSNQNGSRRKSASALAGAACYMSCPVSSPPASLRCRACSCGTRVPAVAVYFLVDSLG